MPTWELKIQKGQKKECRMVNLRLCKTVRPRFQTLRPRLKKIGDSEMQNHPQKKTSRQTLLRFRDLAKI